MIWGSWRQSGKCAPVVGASDVNADADGAASRSHQLAELAARGVGDGRLEAELVADAPSVAVE